MHEDTDVAEAAMDVLLEYSAKKSGSGARQAGKEWCLMLQRVVMFPCRQPVRSHKPY